MVAGTPAGARLRIRLLGGFHVLVDGHVVPSTVWRQRRAAAVVKLLALQPDHRLHREQLMDVLWPDLDPTDQANNLRQMVHHARKHLELAGMERGTVLTRDGEMVVLTLSDDVWVDAIAFEAAVSDAWQSLSPGRAQAALTLYTGDLLPDDRYEAWVDYRRVGLRTSFLSLLVRLGQFHLERGELVEAIAVFERLVAMEPSRESAYVSLMQAYAAIGQLEAALAQYDRLVLALAVDDMSPDDQTLDVVNRIRDAKGHLFFSQLPLVNESRLERLATDLIGRDREIVELTHLISQERLVTLTGPGGVGKTRLATEVARLVDDGSVFVDLAPIQSPGFVLPAIADTLGVREIGGTPLLESICAHVGGRRMLLVIDNVEHLLPARDVIEEVVAALPGATVLVTSRTRLGLRGEREYRVDPLATTTGAGEVGGSVLPPAVELFVQRARAARSEFTWTPENAAAISAICTRLDGLPLALELAAARVRLLTPAAILERIARPLSLLSEGSVTHRPPRQQTMRAAIGWSVDLLSPNEQTLFQQLSVFVGGWTVDAAEAVADIPAGNSGGRAAVPFSILDGLASLVEKHLVIDHAAASGDIRFRMLETIRELGLERLSTGGDLSHIRDRHARWFVQVAEQAATRLELADQARWLARLDEDGDNLRAALLWLTEQGNADLGLRMVNALRLHWFMRGRLVEGCDWLLTMAGLPGSDAYPSLQADALISAGFIAREYGDYERAWAASRDALALSHSLHDRHRAADAMVNLGFIALQRGEYPDARGLFTQALTTYRDIGNQQGIADAVSLLGLTVEQLGDLNAARRLIEEGIAIWRALDDRQALTGVGPWLGNVLMQQGDHAAAYDAFLRALDVAGELGFEWGRSFAFDGLAHLAAVHGEDDLALRLLAAAYHDRVVCGVRAWPLYTSRTDQLIARLRAALGDDVVSRAFHDGAVAAGSPAELDREIRTTLRHAIGTART